MFHESASNKMFPLLCTEEFSQLAVSYESIHDNNSSDSNQLLETLDKFGVAIVTNLCTKEEIVSMEKTLGKELFSLLKEENSPDLAHTPSILSLITSFSNFNLSDRHEEIVRQWPSASLLGAPFVVDYGLPQGKFAWSVRMLPQIRKVYEKLYPSEELVTGMDVLFFKPSLSRPSQSSEFSAHADQNIHAPNGIGDWKVYQSVLYLWPALTEDDATTVVWPGSHKLAYPELVNDSNSEMCGKLGYHYTEVRAMRNKSSAENLERRFLAEARRMRMPAGSLLVWNSKTLHQGWRSGPRLAMPVCWEPRHRRTGVAFLRKIRLILQGLPTTHWASLGYQHDLSLGRSATLRRGHESKDLNGVVLPHAIHSIQLYPLLESGEGGESDVNDA
eukprot:gene29065-38481_t